MRLAALINIVENIENLDFNKFNNNKNNELETSFLPKTYDIYNDSLLEMLLRFKEKLNNNNSITILSVNNDKIDYFLKNIYAFDVNKVVRINRENKKEITPKNISMDIKEYISKNDNFDIILMGKKGMLDGSSLTPYEVANRLNYQIIDNITNIQPLNDYNYVKVTCQENNHIKDIKIKLPMVGIVSDVPNLFLRVPTLKNKLQGKKKTIEIFNSSNKVYNSKVIENEIIKENHSRNTINYKFNSKEDTQQFLNYQINCSNNIDLTNTKTQINYEGINSFKYNGLKVYFCNKENKDYNSFINWNIENHIKQILDISDLIFKDNKVIIKKKIYSENLTSVNSLPHKNGLISICSNKKTINKIFNELNIEIKKEKIEKYKEEINEVLNITKIENDEIIENEKVLIAIGKGVGNKHTLEHIKNFAKYNKIKIVRTRLAAMNTFIPMENMVGVSSKQIAPNLLICIGLSGAPAFYEGVKDAKKIISINNDEDAPIFTNSDIKIVTDLNNIFN